MAHPRFAETGKGLVIERKAVVDSRRALTVGRFATAILGARGKLTPLFSFDEFSKDFNPNHDPRSGEFSSGGASAKPGAYLGGSSIRVASDQTQKELRRTLSRSPYVDLTTAPVEVVDPRDLLATQSDLSVRTVAAYAKQLDGNGNGLEEFAQGYRFKGKVLIEDGHHRVAAAVKMGVPVRMHLVNLQVVTDAAPKTLYVRRDVLNAAEILKWAREQGFGNSDAKQLAASDLHVTVTFSRTPVDWMKMGGETYEAPERLEVPAGGPRMLERFGPEKDAVVLLFNNSQLSWRHEDMVRQGASWDFPEYQPHITIAYDKPPGIDISKITPYRGPIVLGPEIFEEVNENWKAKLTGDFNPNHDPHTGEFTTGGGTRGASHISREDVLHDMTLTVATANQDQPTKSLDELYALARQEEPGFKQSVESVATQLGARVSYTPAAYAEPGTILKSKASAERKLASELGGDVSQLRDVVRATIVTDTVEGARIAAATFMKENQGSILRVKDRIAKPIAGGYRDMLINYRTKGGIVAELQVNSRNMLTAKLGTGHQIYEKLRAMPKNASIAEIKSLQAQTANLYETAYQADGNGHWSVKT